MSKQRINGFARRKLECTEGGHYTVLQWQCGGGSIVDWSVKMMNSVEVCRDLHTINISQDGVQVSCGIGEHN
jgi:hypothetical protein